MALPLSFTLKLSDCEAVTFRVQCVEAVLSNNSDDAFFRKPANTALAEFPELWPAAWARTKALRLPEFLGNGEFVEIHDGRILGRLRMRMAEAGVRLTRRRDVRHNRRQRGFRAFAGRKPVLHGPTLRRNIDAFELWLFRQSRLLQGC